MYLPGAQHTSIPHFSTEFVQLLVIMGCAASRGGVSNSELLRELELLKSNQMQLRQENQELRRGCRDADRDRKLVRANGVDLFAAQTVTVCITEITSSSRLSHKALGN